MKVQFLFGFINYILIYICTLSFKRAYECMLVCKCSINFFYKLQKAQNTIRLSWGYLLLSPQLTKIQVANFHNYTV